MTPIQPMRPRVGGEPKRAARPRPAHAVVRLFNIAPSVLLKKPLQARHSCYYDEFMQKPAAFSQNVRARVEGRERGREAGREGEKQSLNLFILAHLSPHNKPPRTCN